jgi:rSAM/selenodomain-associated transferase 1
MKVICLILKAPRTGTVKTRLAQDIGPKRATLIYRALVEHQAKAIPPEWEVTVHFTPPDAGMEMETWFKPHLSGSVRFVPQCDGDLGQRLINAVRTEFQLGAKRVFLIGGDCPGLSRDYLNYADRILNEKDVVIGPAMDGGYVLLGLKALHIELFEGIAWSTRSVLEQTLAAVHRQALSVGLLPTLEDIDDANGLARQPQFLSVSP